MGINVNLQRIKRARARKISDHFSTVDLFTDTAEVHTSADETSLFLEGPGHEDAAARIAALINEQIIRRDTPLTDEQLAAQEAADEAADEQDRMEEEQAQEDRCQALNDELGPRAASYPREHEEAMIERDRTRDDEVPF